jgi:hypothetical protein
MLPSRLCGSLPADPSLTPTGPHEPLSGQPRSPCFTLHPGANRLLLAPTDLMVGVLSACYTRRPQGVTHGQSRCTVLSGRRRVGRDPPQIPKLSVPCAPGVPPYFQHRPSLEVATRQGQPRSALIIGHHLERDPLVMLARPVTSAGDFAATAGRVDNPCAAKPLKCRLRLHNWEHRENPRDPRVLPGLSALQRLQRQRECSPRCWRGWSHRRRHLRGIRSAPYSSGVQQYSRVSVSA